MDTRNILEQLQEGSITIERAEELLKTSSKMPCEVTSEGISELSFETSSYEELGYAKIDTGRRKRQGAAEVIYCSGKTTEHLLTIFEHIYQKEGEVLGTRASKEQYEVISQKFPQVKYDPVSKIMSIQKEGKTHIGNIAICTAGTADIPVAEEAAQTAEFLGASVQRIYDVGVSGIHRLLAQTEALQKANVIIAVAGMEGALASVIGGIVDKPVIAVPTSVGYGANFGGISALLTMINSCANQVAVVNIDNGFGAGYIACQINRLGVREDE